MTSLSGSLNGSICPNAASYLNWGTGPHPLGRQRWPHFHWVGCDAAYMFPYMLKEARTTSQAKGSPSVTWLLMRRPYLLVTLPSIP